MGDLNYFAIDWNQAAEVLGAVVLLSVFVERSLALLFENKWFDAKFGDRHFKELIALLMSLAVVLAFKFDAVSILMNSHRRLRSASY